MNIDRKTVIWHPDDAEKLIGKRVACVDMSYKKIGEGIYIGKSDSGEHPFMLKGMFGGFGIFCPYGKFRLIAPIPEPKHRPFANAEEFAPHREKWIRTKNGGELWRVYSYNNNGIITPSLNFVDYEKMFGTYDFEDGSPCGMEDV